MTTSITSVYVNPIFEKKYLLFVYIHIGLTTNTFNTFVYCLFAFSSTTFINITISFKLYKWLPKYLVNYYHSREIYILNYE